MPSPIAPVDSSRCAYQLQQCDNRRAVNSLGEQLELCRIHLNIEQQHQESKPGAAHAHLAFSDISDLLEGDRRLQLPLELNEGEMQVVDALLSEHNSQ